MASLRSWVVLADRRKARFFLHVAAGDPLEDAGPGEIAFEPAREPADRPGRVHDRSGSHRHGVDLSTSAAHTERDAVGRAIADVLRAGAEAGEFQRVVLAATPELVGAIRPHLAQAVGQRVVAEIQHRLIDLPPKELAERLTAEGIVGRVSS